MSRPLKLSELLYPTGTVGLAVVGVYVFYHCVVCAPLDLTIKIALGLPIGVFVLLAVWIGLVELVYWIHRIKKENR